MNLPFYNNWFNIRFENQVEDPHRASGNQLIVESKEPIDPDRDYDIWSELCTAARLYSNSTTLPIHILFSGGIDSEMIVRAFLHEGIEFTPVIVRFEDGKNLHDIGLALRICEELDLSPMILDLDVKYIINNILYFEDKYLASVLSSFMYFEARERLGPNVAVVRGEGEPRFIRNQDRTWLNQFSSQGHLRIVEITRDLGYKEDAPLFGMYTSHQYYSYLLDPDSRYYLDIPGVNSLANQKIKIFRKKGFILHDRVKLTGFEEYPEVVTKGNIILYRKYLTYNNLLNNKWN